MAIRTPVASWEPVTGSMIWGKVPLRYSRSEWQRPETAIFRRISCGRRVEGSGTGMVLMEWGELNFSIWAASMVEGRLRVSVWVDMVGGEVVR